MEVHPPDHPIMTWKQFLVHMSTICLGLLIAIGLEQSVEYLHQRHEMREARIHIYEEIYVNVRILHADIAHTDELSAELNHDLDLLRQHASSATAGGDMNFAWDLQAQYRAAYENAHTIGVFSLLPYDEAAMCSDAYAMEAMTGDAMLDLIRGDDSARAAMHGKQLRDLSPKETEDAIDAVSEAVERARLFRMECEVSLAEWQALLSGHYRNDFDGKG